MAIPSIARVAGGRFCEASASIVQQYQKYSCKSSTSCRWYCLMTRHTCSSQTIHYCIGFLYVAGWQSCWYWKVLPASSRMLRRCVGLTVFILKRFHIVTICVKFDWVYKFGASTCIGDWCAQNPEFFCNPQTRSASKYLNTLKKKSCLVCPCPHPMWFQITTGQNLTD